MKLPTNTSEEQRYNFEERAGIHQYDGKLSKESAEYFAYVETFGIEPPVESEQMSLT